MKLRDKASIELCSSLGRSIRENEVSHTLLIQRQLSRLEEVFMFDSDEDEVNYPFDRLTFVP